MNGEKRAGEDMARAEKGDEKDERKGRRLQPSGFDLQAAPPAAPPQDECEREREEREREADTSAGDAFQRLIPGLKKKPDPVPAIVAGLQLHAKHPGVVQSACKALFQLSEADDENDETISRSIKLILSCLRTHKMTAGVQEQGCRLLKNLAASDANQRSIAFDGGIQVQKGLVAAAGRAPPAMLTRSRALPDSFSLFLHLNHMHARWSWRPCGHIPNRRVSTCLLMGPS